MPLMSRRKTSMQSGETSDAIRDQDVTSAGFRCRHDARHSELVASRWCHPIGAHLLMVHETLLHGAFHRTGHGAHHPKVHQVAHADDYHSCRHDASRRRIRALVRAWAHGVLGDREQDAEQHLSTTPRCRRRRRWLMPTNPSTPERSAHRRDGAADVSPTLWAIRGRDAATHQ